MDKLVVHLKMGFISLNHRNQLPLECACVCVCLHGWLVNRRCTRTKKRKKEKEQKKTLPICFKRFTQTSKFKVTAQHERSTKDGEHLCTHNSGLRCRGKIKERGQRKLIYFLRAAKCRLMAFQMPAGNRLGCRAVVYCCGESEMHFNI